MLEQYERLMTVKRDIEALKTSITSATSIISSVAGTLASLKEEITTNANSYYDAADITFIQGKIDAAKTLMTNTNTTVQNL